MAASMVDILQWRALHQPAELAYRFLQDGERDEVTLTYIELDETARSIGALLQSHAKTGDRALLLFPPGMDFIASYYGCLYAGVIAVPAYPPHPARIQKTLSAILGLIDDAEPAIILLPAPLFEVLHREDLMKERNQKIKMLVTGLRNEEDHSGDWKKPQLSEKDIAFLQYTSGSTTAPRGVKVSHGNLLHNLAFIEKSFGQSRGGHAVIWLPPYHDMGLVGGILQPMFTGYPVTLFPHLHFLQRPLRWLEAISRFRATTSGGPNFAYELCLNKIKPEQREQLDLSSWEVAFNGAEPVYHKTLKRFADYFAPCGFRREAFLPCYGLAESTLLVSGGPKSRQTVTLRLVNATLEKNKILVAQEDTDGTRTVVSCGQNCSEQQIRIVNPDTFTACLPDEMGEIWLSGPSVAAGYWNKPEDTEAVFHARIRGEGDRDFLRTGDLGFLQDGELFITGRLKDLIIMEGKNFYAQDIERTVSEADPILAAAGCAAFSVTNDSGSEDLIIVVELEPRHHHREEEIKKSIRAAVSLQQEIKIKDIVITLPGRIPRTTSGKTKRFLCKGNYLAGHYHQNAVS